MPRTYARRAQRDNTAALAEWLTDEDNRKAYRWLVQEVEERHGHRVNEFLSDLLRKCRRYGYLTPAQLAAVQRNMERQAEWNAQRAAEAEALRDVEPLTAGRRTVTAEIISVRWRDGAFPGYKMTVREPNGNKLWGTLPASLDPEIDGPELENGYDGLPGLRVTFTATVQPSDDDPHFGFFKRPAAARVEEVTDEQVADSEVAEPAEPRAGAEAAHDLEP